MIKEKKTRCFKLRLTETESNMLNKMAKHHNLTKTGVISKLLHDEDERLLDNYYRGKADLLDENTYKPG